MTIGAMFVPGEALTRTGAIIWIAAHGNQTVSS
jgi:hypothetical protein